MIQYLVVKKMKNDKYIKYDVAVLGGGASGMMAAIHAAKNGAKVILLEENDILGKKILSTGNGKCNFTNENMSAECFYSEDTAFVKTALKYVSWRESLDFFQNELGVMAINKDGYYYPRSQQAKTIQKALENKVKQQGVEICCNTYISGLLREKDFFQIRFQQGSCMAKKVILSMGGKASDVKGSNGDGYYYAMQFGHTQVPLVPALVQLHTNYPYIQKVAGVRCFCKLSLLIDHVVCREEKGELQLTAQGLSGIAVFQFSRMAAYALRDNKNVRIHVDFLPEWSEDEIWHQLTQFSLKANPFSTLLDVLMGWLHEKLVYLILNECKLSPEICLSDCNQQDLKQLIHTLKEFPFSITQTHGFSAAQVTAGGISTKEIYADTMESKLVPGLFFTGEIMDVDGICGGYNLQWAWTSGTLAGQNATKGYR